MLSQANWDGFRSELNSLLTTLWMWCQNHFELVLCKPRLWSDICDISLWWLIYYYLHPDKQVLHCCHHIAYRPLKWDYQIDGNQPNRRVERYFLSSWLQTLWLIPAGSTQHYLPSIASVSPYLKLCLTSKLCFLNWNTNYLHGLLGCVLNACLHYLSPVPTDFDTRLLRNVDMRANTSSPW